MASITEVLKLCRLCLMKDEVNTPIFEDVNDISQVFLKISTCLPLKVSRDDNLPKNICDNCSYKLELFYEFLHTCTASEKQLITWLNRLGVENLPVPKVINTLPSSHISNVGSVILKQEVPEFMDSHSVDDITPDDLHISSEAQDYVLQQQQQLPYEAVELEFQQENFMDTQPTTNVRQTATVSSKALKRKRPTAGLKVIPSSLDSEDDEDDIGLTGSKLTKTEEDNSDNDADDTAFVDLPSTSGENDQPGPSGVGKVAADASIGFVTYGQLAVFTNVEVDLMYNENQENEYDIDDGSVNSLSFQDVENYDYEVMNMIDEDSLKEILKPNYSFKSKPTPKKCSLCSVCGKYVTMLEKHTKVYHGTYKCEDCLASFRTEHDLEAHKELHGNNEYPCNECTLSFKKPLDYAYHSKEHCALKTYSCPLCQFKTPSRGSVKIHIQHHEKDYKFTCEICNRGFISNSVYTEHVEGHAGIKKFQCDICLKKFLYKRYLMVHRKLNHKKILEGYEDINECHVCQRKFSFEKSLVRHLSKIHGIGKDVSVDCTVCNKKIANAYNLKMHMRTHTGEKPYVCETCGKAFTKRVNLRRHLHNLHD